MVGGDRRAVQAVMPLFELLGKTIVHQGGPGTGQQAKLCNQIVIAGTMIGVCESLLYGYKAGLDLNRMLDSIRGGAAACWTLDTRAENSSTQLRPGIFRRAFRQGYGPRIGGVTTYGSSCCPVSRWCTSSTTESKIWGMAVAEPTR